MGVKVKEWSATRLQSYVKDSITHMLEGTLDFAEVATGDEKRYKSLRSKILRLANDAIRDINAEIDLNYNIEFTGISEDVVKVNQRKGKVNKNDR